MKALILSFFAFFTFASSAIAQFAESGPIKHQIPASLEPISVADMPEGKMYADFERQLLANLHNTKKLFDLILDFDYEVATEIDDRVETKVYQLVYPSKKSSKDVRASLIDWALPIYDYAEGIPEGRWLGNLGQVIQPYVRINNDLRNPEPDSEQTISDVSQIRIALSHLPRYEGISFRGVRLEVERAEGYYQVGKLAEDPAFISTSMRADIAQRFTFPEPNLAPVAYQKINIMFVVKGHSGRPISAIADDHDDEKEILFANGTKFKVVAKSPPFNLREYNGQQILGGRSQVIYMVEE